MLLLLQDSGVVSEATEETVEKLISGCRNLPGKV